MKRKLYNALSGMFSLLAGVMLFWLMIWHVYEADDTATALLLMGAMFSMIAREAYHQSWPVRRSKK